LPFERLVEVINPARSLSRHPLFQVALVLQNNAPVNLEGLPGGLTAVVEPVDITSAKFDLSISLTEQRGADGTPIGILGSLEYATDLFERSGMEALAGRLVRLVEAAVATPDRPIGRLDILSAAERATLLREWNDTARAIPSATLPELFEAQVARTPDAVAVVFADGTLTYGELNARANQLAHHLRALGVGPEVVVGLCVERSLELLIGLLGILKAGGAYLPLDPSYPRERLAFMLADVGAPVLVTQAKLADASPPATHVFCLDRDWNSLAGQSEENPAHLVLAENLAYVIYTSGSTGRPKGVSVPQVAAAQLALETHYVSIEPDDRIGQAANISFDATTFEIWGALLNGAAVQFVSQDDLLDPDRFGAYLRSGRLDILFLTTALFNRLVQADSQIFRSLKYLLFGGEAVDTRQVAAVLTAGKPRHLLHVYGPTESTTFATWHEVERIDAATVPIGRPLGNYR